MSKTFTDVAHIGQVLRGVEVITLINDGFLEITGVSFERGDLPTNFIADDIEENDIFVASVNTNCGVLEFYSIAGDGFVRLHTDTVVDHELAQRNWG